MLTHSNPETVKQEFILAINNGLENFNGIGNFFDKTSPSFFIKGNLFDYKGSYYFHKIIAHADIKTYLDMYKEKLLEYDSLDFHDKLRLAISLDSKYQDKNYGNGGYFKGDRDSYIFEFVYMLQEVYSSIMGTQSKIEADKYISANNLHLITESDFGKKPKKVYIRTRSSYDGTDIFDELGKKTYRIDDNDGIAWVMYNGSKRRGYDTSQQTLYIA